MQVLIDFAVIPSLIRPSSGDSAVRSFSSDEFPVDETFLENFTPREQESEEEARRRNWIERGWAPWEEILTPEADFARKSLNEGEEVALQSPEAIEAFKMLKPSYRKKKMEECGLSEEEYLAKQFEIKGEILEPLETTWSGPLVLRVVPPRDWPPRGWKVDEKELAFIREAHRLQAERVDLDKCLETARRETDDMCLERMTKITILLELPFFYPGQICSGKVTALHLYQGAFVDIGGVYDGWVPIKGNDWYWIRQFIKVGMHVIVEILHSVVASYFCIAIMFTAFCSSYTIPSQRGAKRDPYRFRFPIEMRFVNPNIDHLIFNRFEFPPIFHREEDTNPEEIRRDCGRLPEPRKRTGVKIEEEPLLSDHPYVDRLWQLNVAEQMILDDEEANPDKYRDGKFEELMDDDEFDEEKSIEYTHAHYKNSILPKMILKTNVKELDLKAARAERELNRRLEREAKERGEFYKVAKLRRNLEMDEYDFIHWQRSVEEREALIRDISCRRALGLPLEEPGRYVDASQFGKDHYDPSNPLYRYDYWGEPKNSEKSRQEKMTDLHNKSIVGKGTVWYEMSYEDAIEQRMKREANSDASLKEEEEHTDIDQDDDDDDDEDDDFDYSILSNPEVYTSKQPVVNGTESSRLSDEGMFED
ncbi:hypothetical protein Syun_024426 [Stephania yunnanensis]|uniref:S1 motif domain-containing protein n=1 Tax=Stephania yunnanensis TaxID=152371 RepID=A0AAP0NJ45_9MAGN